jgi:hypothetical protein
MLKKLFFFFVLILLVNTTYGQILAQKHGEPKSTITQVAAYPNPLDKETQITFYSNMIQNVIFEVKNVLGKSVYKIKMQTKIGYNELVFNKQKLSSGMYIYSLQTNAEIVSKRLVIK